jgi:archaellum biogenesis ATPase FlaH
MFKTDIGLLDDVIGGGIPDHRISAVFGSPNVGKSVLSVQTSLNAILEDKNVLYISSMSEKDSREYLNIFNARYPEWKNKKDNINFLSVIDLKDLADKFDYFLNITYSDTKSENTMGKASVVVRNEPEIDIIQKTFKRENFGEYDFIVIDSLSELVKLDIFSEMQNFPARSQILTFLFSIFNDAINDFDNTFLITHHLTKAITGYGAAAYVWGGAAIGYLSKHILELDQPKKSSYDRFKKEGRSVKIYRWPAIAESPFYDICLLKDWGYVDKQQYIEVTGKDPDKKKKRKKKKENILDDLEKINKMKEEGKENILDDLEKINEETKEIVE